MLPRLKHAHIMSFWFPSSLVIDAAIHITIWTDKARLATDQLPSRKGLVPQPAPRQTISSSRKLPSCCRSDWLPLKHEDNALEQKLMAKSWLCFMTSTRNTPQISFNISLEKFEIEWLSTNSMMKPQSLQTSRAKSFQTTLYDSNS